MWLWKYIIKQTKNTAQKIKFPIKHFFSKCDQICSFLWLWPNLLKKALIESLCSEIFCAVKPHCFNQNM